MRLKQLSERLELTLHGDPTQEVSSIATLQRAGENDLCFVAGARYVDALCNCKAGVIVVPASLAEQAPGNYLVSDNPYLTYARASQLLYPSSDYSTGIAESARINPSASLGKNVSIGEHCVVDADAVLGDDCIIGPGCHIGARSCVGARTRFFANVCFYHDCRTGTDCRVQAGAVIGSEGFGYAPSNSGWVRINQIGGVDIGDRVEIGANTTIDRGAIDDTVIGDGVILDNQIQIAHNVSIGENTAIAGCAGIAGSTVVGKNCRIGGKVAIVGHISIADNVTLTATSFVSRSISEAGVYSSGMPLQKNGLWRKTFARLSHLDEFARRLKRVEKPQQSSSESYRKEIGR